MLHQAKKSGWLCLLLLSFAVSLGEAAEPEQFAFLHNGVTAHRGNSSEFPENTLHAFQSGIDAGADWLELDLFRTKDGQLVVTHDRTTGRVAGRNLDVTESTYAELLELDVATEFRRVSGQPLDVCPPCRIPTLKDVLELVQQQRKTRVSLQPKMDCVAEAIEQVKNLKAEPWVGFNDGNLKYMADVKRLAPEIPVFWDRGPNTNIAEDIRIARQHGFESLVLNERGVTAEKVQQIKEAGLEVGAWTVNDRETMQKMLDLGVERIYTDYPRQLLALQQARRWPDDIECEGRYKGHLQGVCTDGEFLYWSFTTQFVKTDRQGQVLVSIPVDNHHGDLCHHDGKLYVAVNLGKFNQPPGQADSWVYVYEADSLKEISRHPVPEAVHGAGGMEYLDGKLYVVGGLPTGYTENFVFEYDMDLNFQKRHTIASGYTRLGIQTATWAEGRWWMGCYGSPAELLVTDKNFNLLKRYPFNCSLGLVALPEGRFLVAGNRNIPGEGHKGWLKAGRLANENQLELTPKNP